MAAAQIHHSGIKSRYSMPLAFCRLDKSVRHSKAVPILSGTAGNYNNFIAHKSFLLSESSRPSG